MTLKEDIENKANEIFNEKYDESIAYTTPSRESLTFGATANNFNAIVMYIDIRGSKDLLNNHNKLTVLKAHKAFLYTVTKAIRNRDGNPRSFNGDSILAFWPNTNSNAIKAVRTAMEISYLINYVLNPIMEGKYKNILDFGIGIAQGDLMVGKSGIKGDETNQDLIWIGWPTYHAYCMGDKAKSTKHIWISENIYKNISTDDDMIYSNGNSMWTSYHEDLGFGSFNVYKTSYYWTVS